jgi:hypothetical protein
LFYYFQTGILEMMRYNFCLEVVRFGGQEFKNAYNPAIGKQVDKYLRVNRDLKKVLQVVVQGGDSEDDEQSSGKRITFGLSSSVSSHPSVSGRELYMMYNNVNNLRRVYSERGKLCSEKNIPCHTPRFQDFEGLESSNTDDSSDDKFPSVNESESKRGSRDAFSPLIKHTPTFTPLETPRGNQLYTSQRESSGGGFVPSTMMNPTLPSAHFQSSKGISVDQRTCPLACMASLPPPPPFPSAPPVGTTSSSCSHQVYHSFSSSSSSGFLAPLGLERVDSSVPSERVGKDSNEQLQEYASFCECSIPTYILPSEGSVGRGRGRKGDGEVGRGEQTAGRVRGETLMRKR